MSLELFDDPAWDELNIFRDLKHKAGDQLGTVGSGNHCVDLLLGERDRAWVGVHFGSRGLGHSFCTHFIKLAERKDGIHAVKD